MVYVIIWLVAAVLWLVCTTGLWYYYRKEDLKHEQRLNSWLTRRI
jgi:hypothetical protein